MIPSSLLSPGLLMAAAAIVLVALALFLALDLLRRVGQLHERMRRRTDQLHALHEASLTLTAELSREPVLQKVVDLSRRLADARYGALAVIDESGHIESFITSGIGNEERERIGSPPEGRGLLGAVLDEGCPIRVADIQQDPRSVGFPPHHPAMKSFLGVPIMFKGRTLGNLYLADKETASEFGPEDEELLTMFATQAAIAVENARLYEQVQTLAVMTERQRIAREMHDSLAQVLSYVVSKSQAVQELLWAERFDEAQTELQDLSQMADEVYADVREAILGLRTTIGKERGLFSVLREYLQRFSEQSGVETEFVVTPDADAFSFEPATEIQLLRIVQEALTNVRKHARARRAWVRFEADDGWAVVSIEDDGRGFDPGRQRRSAWPCFGLQIMQERADTVGGSLEIDSRPGKGTRVQVRVPLQSMSLS